MRGRRLARGLTAGERRYAAEVFGGDLDQDAVRVHNRRAYFFQPRHVAMAPDGHIYFAPESYKPDFSTCLTDAAWLIHELVHVWQHQQGMWVRLRGVLNRRYRYGSLAGAGRPFLGYGIEQQAAIVEDCFRLSHGLPPLRGAGSPDDYRRLIPFLVEGRP